MKRYIYLFLCLIGSLNAIAQTQTVEGLIMDAQTKEALVGVNVLITGSTQGTTTNLNGYFRLTSETNINSLSISYIGYEKQEVTPSGQSIKISLKPSATTLQQVVVSASRDAQLRSDAPVAITSVSPTLIDETKASSLDQVLNKVTGVFMVDLGNEQHSMSIRQPLSYKSLFLYLEDGLPIRPTGVFNHNALIEMNMEALKTVEVIRGPSSALYGSEAIGGAMNFIIQRATAVPTASISFQGDSEGYSRVNFRMGNTVNQKLGVSVGGYYAKRQDGFRDHSDMDKLAITATVDYRLGENTKLETTTSYVDFHTDMTGSLDSARFYGKEYSSVHTFTERTVKAFRSQVKLSHNWTDNSKTDFRVFFRDNSVGQIPTYRVRDDRSWSNPSGDPLLAHGEVNEQSFRSYGTLVQHNQSISDKLTFRVGASIDISPSSYWGNYIRIARTEEGIYSGYEEMPDSVLTSYDVDLINTAAYTQVSYQLTERLNIVASLRYDRFGFRYDNHLPSTAFSGAPDENNSFSALTPRLGLTYNVNDELGFYANYSKGFVPPQIGELYRGVKVPTLQPAIYHNYEAGGWLAIPQIKGFADLAVYRLNGTDEILSVQLDDGSFENRNAGSTRHQGIEMSLRGEPITGLQLRVGATVASHTFMEYVENGVEFNENQMDRAPRVISNSEITYRPEFISGLRVALEWQHISPYYMDAANTVKYEGFDIFNLRIGYKVSGIEFWGNIMNIADVVYATNASRSRWGTSYSPGIPRLFQFGIGYSIKN